VIWGRALVLLTAVALVGSVVTAAGGNVNSPGGAGPRRGLAACQPGSKRAVVGGKVKCLRVGQACAARYQAAYKKHGFTCVKGHLRKRSTPTRPAPAAPPTTTPPTPPTPPPPPAQTGHYKGTTSQLEVFEFDVTASGNRVENFATGQINEGCNPPAHLSGGNFSGGSGPISADGTFKFDFDYASTVSGAPSKGHLTLTGRFAGNTASGTLQDTQTFTFEGVEYTCGSGQQTWTANKTG
jgi:hypothetical protein